MISTRQFLKSIALLLGMATLLVTIAAPAVAHKEHKRKQAVAERVEHPGEQADAPVALQGDAPPRPNQVAKLAEEEMVRPHMSLGDRLLDWLGRLHPVVVHFPIAFFPAALFAALVGRSRPAFTAPVQFLVVTGGIIGAIATVLGWFDGSLDMASDDWLLHWHRWIGTAIGIGALGLGISAWRRPDAIRSSGMIFGLTAMTAAIAAQGWFGGAMVHGVDHMNW